MSFKKLNPKNKIVKPWNCHQGKMLRNKKKNKKKYEKHMRVKLVYYLLTVL